MDQRKPYHGSEDGYEIECCPHCENEIELLWDINKNGFQAVCPICGYRLMLCDACRHRTGELIDDCDYDPKENRCRFSASPDWWKPAETETLDPTSTVNVERIIHLLVTGYITEDEAVSLLYKRIRKVFEEVGGF